MSCRKTIEKKHGAWGQVHQTYQPGMFFLQRSMIAGPIVAER
jgi:hypothetical protein